MCNDYRQHIAWAQYQRLEIPAQQNELNLPRADDIRIGDDGPVMRRRGDAVELASMRFGFAPAKPKMGRSSTSDPNAAAANAGPLVGGGDIARRNLTAADSVCNFSTRQARDVRV
jgi:putative SOS response-associated peptidase YedK